ncbi:MAG: Sec-independent protein translocase subunit TatB [Comamonas sp.]|nr:Sec-independent protein translocase subunit TatB [Comamonas sp.]
MLDIGLSKLALIGAVALVVIGPEKLPKVARTLGSLIGRAQRYVADVKAEVNQSMQLDELRKMKETVESAAREVQTSVQTTVADLDKEFDAAIAEAERLAKPDFGSFNNAAAHMGFGSDEAANAPAASQVVPSYTHPGKKFRLKRSAIPRWYKLRTGTRTHVQSGAARVARFRPKR